MPLKGSRTLVSDGRFLMPLYLKTAVSIHAKQALSASDQLYELRSARYSTYSSDFMGSASQSPRGELCLINISNVVVARKK
jgi:hypothetical protein